MNALAKRQSNIELLRIISMIMIVANHLAGHGVMYKWDPLNAYIVWSKGSLVNQYFSSFLSLGGEIGVAIFFIITGYFLCKKEKTHLSKLLNSTIFYGLLTTVACALVIIFKIPIRGLNLTLESIVKTLFIPMTGGTWWFITAYFFLVLLAPILNNVINNINRGGWKRRSAILFFLWLFWYVLGKFALFSELEKGIFFYYIGSLFRLERERKHGKSLKYTKTLTVLIMIIAYSFGTFIRHHDGMMYKLDKSANNNYLMWELIITALIVPICACIWFYLFVNLDIGANRFINNVASTTLGIYLIHESTIGRPLIWYNIFNVDTVQYKSALFPIYSIITVICVFVMCSFIDGLRLRYIEPFQEKVELRILKNE